MRKFLLKYHSPLILLSCVACLLDLTLDNTVTLALVIIFGPLGLVAMALDMYQNRRK